ncbi:Tim44/TimA family putative adaptor protein [Aestuariivirga litoralis]|uniref:Tim44/TimA family putative adaptor protein n=1 Tax=Aestuariivirga litoralis TaxID=2650924 RepID=UPI0018C7A30A|nr:Tim44/TimA family putative adaptor protein [Aestuariivirga litoralis]
MAFLSDPITIIFFAIFAFAGFRLYQVLGHRSTPEKPQPPSTIKTAPLPGDLELKANEPAPRKIWEGFAPQDSTLAKTLIAMGEADHSFDTSDFIRGARSAHERIMESFAKGDVKTLSLLLTQKTFAAFEKEISRRASQGEVAAFKFVGIKESKLVEAALNGNMAQLRVHFVTELISAVKDVKGRIISGDDKRIAEVKEFWTFERDLKGSEAGWRLAETHDED